jgi:hypothetical protein
MMKERKDAKHVKTCSRLAARNEWVGGESSLGLTHAINLATTSTYR